MIPKSKYIKKADKTTGDSVKDLIKQTKTEKEASVLVYDRAKQAYNNLSDFRNRRHRVKRYIYGDQWGDYIQVGGRWIKERARIEKRTGGAAFQNNHMVKIINTMKGMYAKNQATPTCYALIPNADDKSVVMTNALQSNYDRNREKELLNEEWTEMLEGGLPVVKEVWANIDGTEDSYTLPINPDYFFFESAGQDPRGFDVTMVGEFSDYEPYALASKICEFTGEDPEKELNRVNQIYKAYRLENELEWKQQTDKNKSVDWDVFDTKYCRVYEVWTKEQKIRYRCSDDLDKDNPLYKIDAEDMDSINIINDARLAEGIAQGLAPEDIPLIETEKIWDSYWYCRMFTPTGEVLVEYESPYDHKSHPYTFLAAEFVDGDIVPFMSTIIDQQRYINRLITLKDLMIQSSVKGVKMIPKDAIPKDMSASQFAKQFVELGQFIIYEPSKSGNKPEVVNASVDIRGVDELLQLEIQSMGDILNVNDAVRGKTPGRGTSAAQYAIETENASTSTYHILLRFNNFEMAVAKKKMKTIQQYYQQPRMISNIHSGGYGDYTTYDPQEVADIDFEIVIRESAETPVSRMQINDLAMQLWQAGAIDAEGMLESICYPGKNVLQQAVRRYKEQMMQQQAAMAQQTQAQ